METEEKSTQQQEKLSQQLGITPERAEEMYRLFDILRAKLFGGGKMPRPQDVIKEVAAVVSDPLEVGMLVLKLTEVVGIILETQQEGEGRMPTPGDLLLHSALTRGDPYGKEEL